MKYDFDLIVIGGGQSGVAAARAAVASKKKVAIVEEKKVGGHSVFAGAVPRMALGAASELAAARSALSFWGIYAQQAALHTAGVMNTVRQRMFAVAQTFLPEELSKEGISVIAGAAKFINKKTIVVGERQVRAKRYVIATGSRHILPDIEGLALVPYLTSQTLWDCERVPESIIFVGADACGVELAYSFASLGSRVTLIESGQRLLPHEDADTSEWVRKYLEGAGVTIKRETRVVQASPDGLGVQLACSYTRDKDAHVKFAICAERLFVATSRLPNIHDLGLESTGISFGEPGIVVNSALRTTGSHLFACGGAVGAASHESGAQGARAGRNASVSRWRRKSYIVHHAARLTRVGVEIASMGLTEQQAHKLYDHGVIVKKNNYTQTLRGLIEQAPGYVKVIRTKKGAFLGVHCVGPRAGELVRYIQRLAARGVEWTADLGLPEGYPAYLDLAA